MVCVCVHGDSECLSLGVCTECVVCAWTCVQTRTHTHTHTHTHTYTHKQTYTHTLTLTHVCMTMAELIKSVDNFMVSRWTKPYGGEH